MHMMNQTTVKPLKTTPVPSHTCTVILSILKRILKKLTTCLKCNTIVTVQNKTNQQLLIETLAFY